MDEGAETLSGVGLVSQKQQKKEGKIGPLARRIEQQRIKKLALSVDLEQKAAEKNQITEAQKRVNVEMRRQIRKKEAKEKAAKVVKNSPLGLTAAVERQIKEETGMTVGEIVGEGTDKS